MANNPLVFIDDDSEDLSLMKEMAMAIYFPNTVMAFDKPELAIEYLQSLQVAPLFILSDINMPKVDGWELQARIKNISVVVGNTPFIFLSTSKTKEEVLRAERLDAWGFYQKPDSLNGIIDLLHSIMISLKDGAKYLT